MLSASLWAIFSGKIIFILRLSRPAGFSFSLFHGKGRNGKRQLAGAGSLLGNEPSQALRASSPEGRAKTVEGTLLASPFERLPPVGGRCRAATKRGQGVTEGDGEGAPAPLRGAAAAAAEGPSNRRSAKNAFSEATSIFPLRPLLWDYQGRVALDSWVQRVEIAGTFLVLFWCQKRTIPARLQRIEIAVPLPR